MKPYKEALFIMRKNCPNCGERFEGDVCPKCGTVVSRKTNTKTNANKLAEDAIADKFLTEEQRAAAQAQLANRKKDRSVLIFLIIIVLLAVGFILYRSGFVGGGSYKKPIEQYFQGISSRDFDIYVGSMLNNIGGEYIKEKEELGYSGYDYMDKLYRDLFEQFGEDMTITLIFNSRGRTEHEYVQSFADGYMEDYGEAINSKAAYTVKTTVHFSGSISSGDVEMDCFVLRHKGKWYIVGCDFSMEEDK